MVHCNQQPAKSTIPVPNFIAFHDFHPNLGNIREEVLNGLTQSQKMLPPKLFYDQQGSALFEEICTLEEYYLTRTELSLFQIYCSEMAALMGENCLLIEYGSGSSVKIRILLDALKHNAIGYLAIDISKEHLVQSVSHLAAQYPDLKVIAVCADYTQPIQLPPFHLPVGQKVIFFPGSTIGNFTPEQALVFLKNAAQLISPNGGLLIGVDLKKDETLLNAAYNDQKGVTARFNLNLLTRINNELGAQFDLKAFQHHAFYNPLRGCIEMHLISLNSQTVQIGTTHIHFRKDETIHTEDSFKYSVEEFQAMAVQAGFQPTRVWTDAHQLFSIHYLHSS